MSDCSCENQDQFGNCCRARSLEQMIDNRNIWVENLTAKNARLKTQLAHAKGCLVQACHLRDLLDLYVPQEWKDILASLDDAKPGVSHKTKACYGACNTDIVSHDRCPVCGLNVIGIGDNRSCVDPSCFCADSSVLREREKPRQEGGGE